MELKVIARMKSDFPAKFGIPRQSGLVDELISHVVMEKEYAVAEALRGIEEFSHLFLIWGFSEISRESWSPTVRPPRLGGNTRMGVFATRSPYRPNPIGLSCVRLLGIVSGQGPLMLEVAGADLMDGTPIYDIKPYLPYTDSHPEAAAGFAGAVAGDRLDVDIPDGLLALIPPGKQAALFKILRGDPRPGYLDDPERVFGFVFAGREIRFRVRDRLLTVCEIREV